VEIRSSEGAECGIFSTLIALRSVESSLQAAEDVRLVALLARGDASALGLLYDRHAPALLALAQRLTGKAAAAEDIVHDVFLEAWQCAADYDSTRGSVRAWLWLRARSRSIDYKRSHAVARVVAVESMDWLEQAANGAAGNSLGADRPALRRVLASLSCEQRAVLALGYFEGLSSREISERLNIPIGTVKSRLAAALSSLRRALGDTDCTLF
jgi:RNA polymerase sigma-70 factor (ECF subfamily)